MFVAITKTVGDYLKRPPQHINSHPAYPVECVEYEDIYTAEKENPGCKIMSHEEYCGYKSAMNLTHGIIQKPKAWWKFWGKK